MNGVHDLGGMHGFGAVEVEENEPIFHELWEKHVFGMTMSTMGTLYNLDEFRHAIERMNPAEYLGSTYYEHWLAAMETLLVEKGILTTEELKSRSEELASIPRFEEAIPKKDNPELAQQMVQMIKAGFSTQREGGKPPQFQPGDKVVVCNIHPSGHTRCPRYVRRAQGVIDRFHGTFIFPDTNAHGAGEQPEAVYTVRFDAHELWGANYKEGPDSINIDLWESYLKAA